MKKKCCIVVPIYNVVPEKNEIISINRVIDVFSDTYDIIYVCADSFEADNYPKLKSRRFKETYFKIIRVIRNFFCQQNTIVNSQIMNICLLPRQTLVY